eukprot:2772332-Pleurochrysis_carterae.AAC.1
MGVRLNTEVNSSAQVNVRCADDHEHGRGRHEGAVSAGDSMVPDQLRSDVHGVSRTASKCLTFVLVCTCAWRGCELELQRNAHACLRTRLNGAIK